MTQENPMQFPFETKTRDGRKVTVLGAMPDGRLAGYIMRGDSTFTSWHWNADGSSSVTDTSITLPLQIKPLTTYRMRNGGIAWTTGWVPGGRIYGLTVGGYARSWFIDSGRWGDADEDPLDLVAELPPGTALLE